MNPSAATVLATAGVLIVARLIAQIVLERINQKHLAAQGPAVPPSLQAIYDPETFSKSIRYTLAKSRLTQLTDALSAIITLLLIFTPLLGWLLQVTTLKWGTSAWSAAAFLFTTGVILSLAQFPLDYYEQFNLEDKFGFNTTTLKTWIADRVKGLLLALVIGYPLLALILFLAARTGAHWWIWAWLAMLSFQFVMLLLAPVFILPLFNKLTPLPDGSLRTLLLDLGKKTGFHAGNIQVMDGSKRSKHSNAFFTGFGGARKIVLFDTLLQQLTEPEIEGVLAHEIGHYKMRHIPKMLAWSAISTFAGFAAIAWLARQPWFAASFGYPSGSMTAAFLLFALLSGAVTFWVSPLTHGWSRKYEYEADAYARHTLGTSAPLIGALRKLNEKNLSNPFPHPAYSRFYYSHPTLQEREKALSLLQQNTVG